MGEVLHRVLGVSLAVFLVGSMLQTGLEVRLREAWAALCNARFVAIALLLGFVAGPALAFALTEVLPLEPGHANGLLLLGMAPCAPFVPLAARRAGGDLAYVAALLLLATVGTVLLMPFAVPVLAAGLAPDAWTVMRPLLLLVLLPLAVGGAIRLAAGALARAILPLVRKATALAIVAMLLAAVALHWRDMVGAVGSFAIFAQFAFYALLGAAGYASGIGLPHAQRSVLALGMCTRNIGAALAPLLAVQTVDQRALTTCILAALITMVTGFGGARLLASWPRSQVGAPLPR